MRLFESTLEGAMIGLMAGLIWVVAADIGQAHWHRIAHRLAWGACGGAVGGAIGSAIHALLFPDPIIVDFLLRLSCIIIGAGGGAIIAARNRPSR